MPDVTKEDILEVLKTVTIPASGKDIVSLGMVSGLTIRPTRGSELQKGSEVWFAIEVDPATGQTLEPVRRAAEEAVYKMKAVSSVSAVMTAHTGAPTTPLLPPPKRVAKARTKLYLPNIRRIIAVASGKGGVGKSTTAVNLAISFMQNGLRVGLLDADIYGPSIPRMLDLYGKPKVDKDNKMIPKHWNGLSVMSMGFLIEENEPMVWRGPMVHGAITQMFRDVAWGKLDVLLVDLPPGTGDAQLTLSQQVPLAGAIIVSTPQDIALIDARKGLGMFQKVDVPVLGIIENMSYFKCPHCGEHSDIFSHGGARLEAEALNIPFLGEVPLNIALRKHSDEGMPLAFAERDGELAVNYRNMARTVWKALNPEAKAVRKPAAPKIVVQKAQTAKPVATKTVTKTKKQA
jgi:ATP-binding protein involved in chromosome partitioning